MRRLIFGHLLVVAVLALSACTPESLRSLPEETRIEVDRRLIGTWRAEVLGNEHVAVVTESTPNVLQVTLRSVSLEGAKRGIAPRETRHELRFYMLNGMPVIAERGPSFVDGRTVHRFASYQIARDGSVTLLYTHQEPIWKWVSSLRLGGEVRSDDPLFHDVIVSAPSARLAAVMGGYTPEQLFGVPFGPFERQ